MRATSRFTVSRLSGSGRHRRQLLLVGDECLTGSEESPATGLGPALVHASADFGARGLDVDVLTNLVPALRTIDGAASAWRLWRYDAVVVVVDVATSTLRTPRLQQVLLKVLGDLADAGRLAVVLTDNGRRPTGEVDLTSRRPRLTEADLPPGAIAVHGDVAGAPEAVALELLRLMPTEPIDHLPPGSAAERRSQPQDESLRQVAVDRSIAMLPVGTAHLQRAVVLAQNSFDVPFAQVNLVSRGRLRSLAYIGRSSDGLTHSLSGMAVQGEGPLMISDTLADERCTTIPETKGPDAIRFYAGHPIESLDGYRIGVVCVLDTRPHEILAGDDVLLRDVALLAEAELNALTRPARRSARHAAI